MKVERERERKDNLLKVKISGGGKKFFLNIMRRWDKVSSGQRAVE